MKRKKGSLGKGLSVILGSSIKNTHDNEESISNNKTDLLISQIEINPFQPRLNFNDDKLNELASSIKQLGVIQPITVRKISEKKYQLITGERRLRASKIAEIKRIPAYIRIANDEEMLEMALVENIQREDLNPIEIALSYERLISECNLTQEECSKKVGKNRTTITNFLRLLKLPQEIQQGLSLRKITTGHARALINIKSKENQINIYYDTIANGYSVRDVEEIAKTFSTEKYSQISRNKYIADTNPFEHQKIVYDLSKKLNTNIEIKCNKKTNGKLLIYFENNEELERIFKHINK